MTSKPNVIVVQKTTGKGTTIQGLPGKNVVTTLLNAGVSKNFEFKVYGQVTGCVSCCVLYANMPIKSKLCMSSVTDTACFNVWGVWRVCFIGYGKSLKQAGIVPRVK